MDELAPALKLIKCFEGCKLEAYTDIVGRLTIGWGTAHDVTPDMKITQEEADKMLLDDCMALANKIESIVKTEISQNSFCALISFAYNLGFGNLFHSTLLTKINSGAAKYDCAQEILKWDHAGGQVVPGLTARRRAEAALFVA